MIKMLVCVVVLSVVSMSSVFASGNQVKGKALYASCLACHGGKAEGNPALKAPALSALPAWYIAKQLKNFKAGIRGGDAKDVAGTQMRLAMGTLSNDQAMADVAVYIVSLKGKVRPVSSVRGMALKGRVHYMACIACHGAKGKGNESLKAPALAGQSDWYLLTQLKNFKSGLRGKHPKDANGAQMRAYAMGFGTEQDMKHVISYINSLSK